MSSQITNAINTAPSKGAVKLLFRRKAQSLKVYVNRRIPGNSAKGPKQFHLGYIPGDSDSIPEHHKVDIQKSLEKHWKAYFPNEDPSIDWFDADKKIKKIFLHKKASSYDLEPKRNEFFISHKEPTKEFYAWKNFFDSSCESSNSKSIASNVNWKAMGNILYNTLKHDNFSRIEKDDSHYLILKIPKKTT